MRIEETKNNLITLLDKVGFDKDFTEVAKDFINTYDGNQETTFSAFMMHIIVLLMHVQKLEVKAKGFDDINEKNDDFKIAFNRIKSDYDKLNSGQDLTEPAQSSN